MHGTRVRSAAAVLFLIAAATASAAPARTAPRVRLVWFDPLNALPCPFETLGRNVRDVFAVVGVDVVWERGTQDLVLGPEDVQLILLDDLRSVHNGSDTMGLVEPRTPTRVAWILLPSVKRALGVDPTPGRLLDPSANRDLALALSRVVAHEVVHAVAPRVPHASKGLMAPRLDRGALLKPLIGLDAASVAVFVDAVRNASRSADASGLGVGLR
jgi:hypothetical protein